MAGTTDEASDHPRTRIISETRRYRVLTTEDARSIAEKEVAGWALPNAAASHVHTLKLISFPTLLPWRM